MRTWFALLLLSLVVLLTACGYETAVTRRETPGPTLKSPDPERYGSLQITWVHEYRKPKGLTAFPDGGKPRDVARYGIVRQIGPGVDKEVGKIEMQPVRTNDYGDLVDFTHEWHAPNHLGYTITNGYLPPDVKKTEGELKLQPLR